MVVKLDRIALIARSSTHVDITFFFFQIPNRLGSRSTREADSIAPRPFDKEGMVRSDVLARQMQEQPYHSFHPLRSI